MKSILVLLNVSVGGKFHVLCVNFRFWAWCTHSTVYAPVEPGMLLQNRIFTKNTILMIWLDEIGKDTLAMTPDMAFWDHKPLFCLIKKELAMF